MVLGKPCRSGLRARGLSASICAAQWAAFSCPTPRPFLEALGGGWWESLQEHVTAIAVLKVHATPYLTLKNVLTFQLISSHLLTYITAFHFYDALPKLKTMCPVSPGMGMSHTKNLISWSPCYLRSLMSFRTVIVIQIILAFLIRMGTTFFGGFLNPKMIFISVNLYEFVWGLKLAIFANEVHQ